MDSNVARFIYSKSFISLKWFLLHLGPNCTTTTWQMLLKIPPKFGDVMWCFHITFMQKYLLSIGDFELYTNFSNLVQWALLHYNPFKYFFKNSSKCLEMTVDAYNSSSSKKTKDVLWKIWVDQPLLHSGLNWWFVLQPYFSLL